MTYQELIDNIRDLGFSDNDEMSEFAESGLLYTAINRSITRINLEVSPILEKYEFEITDDDAGYMYITFTDIDDMFLKFADTPVLFRRDETEFYKKFSSFDIEMENTLVINAEENKGYFRVFYVAQHENFTGKSSQLKEELPLQLKVHHLVPLLAAYYVWLEDDPTKAAQYYNMYDSVKNEMKLEEQSKVKMRVNSDWFCTAFDSWYGKPSGSGRGGM